MSTHEMDQFSRPCMPVRMNEDERKEQARRLRDVERCLEIPDRLRQIRIECAIADLPTIFRWLALIEEDEHALPDALGIDAGYRQVIVWASVGQFRAQAAIDTSAHNKYWPVFESAAAAVLEALKCRGGEVSL